MSKIKMSKVGKCLKWNVENDYVETLECQKWMTF